MAHDQALDSALIFVLIFGGAGIAGEFWGAGAAIITKDCIGWCWIDRNQDLCLWARGLLIKSFY